MEARVMQETFPRQLIFYASANSSHNRITILCSCNFLRFSELILHKLFAGWYTRTHTLSFSLSLSFSLFLSLSVSFSLFLSAFSTFLWLPFSVSVATRAPISRNLWALWARHGKKPRKGLLAKSPNPRLILLGML